MRQVIQSVVTKRPARGSATKFGLMPGLALGDLTMRTDNSLAAVVPYGHFIDGGEVYLRGRGLMSAYELGGLSLASASKAELAAAVERLVEALRHLGTNDMVQVIVHRLPATKYPERSFPSRAARLIDDERREQFAAQNYWHTLRRIYFTTQMEAAVPSHVRSAVFSAGHWNPKADLILQRFRERQANVLDALGGIIPLRRLAPIETFRDLILAVTGRDYPAIMPAGKVRLNEIIASERWYGGVAPWIGELHLRQFVSPPIRRRPSHRCWRCSCAIRGK